MKQIITITNVALNKLHNILERTKHNAIRFSIKGGGCNGFNYELTPTNNLPNKLDEIVKIKNVEIHVCNKSLIHIIGTNIDWKEDVMGSSFQFDNPMAKSNCGCGTSFTSKAFDS